MLRMNELVGLQNEYVFQCLMKEASRNYTCTYWFWQSMV